MKILQFVTVASALCVFGFSSLSACSDSERGDEKIEEVQALNTDSENIVEPKVITANETATTPIDALTEFTAGPGIEDITESLDSLQGADYEELEANLGPLGKDFDEYLKLNYEKYSTLEEERRSKISGCMAEVANVLNGFMLYKFLPEGPKNYGSLTEPGAPYFALNLVHEVKANLLLLFTLLVDLFDVGFRARRLEPEVVSLIASALAKLIVVCFKAGQHVVTRVVNDLFGANLSKDSLILVQLFIYSILIAFMARK